MADITSLDSATPRFSSRSSKMAATFAPDSYVDVMHVKLTKVFESTLPFALGDRVRMSALGLKRHPKYGDREGVIVGMGSPSSFRVKFDGRKSVQTIHHSYLVKIETIPPGD